MIPYGGAPINLGREEGPKLVMAKTDNLEFSKRKMYLL
jgi:hypothetical protein